jgi:hypothetical protein
LKISELLLGRRLANREYGERKIGAFEGVPAMGLDALGSSSYGPEAALAILAVAGAASLTHLAWVMAPIVALLLILFLSYWQTIRAYPITAAPISSPRTISAPAPAWSPPRR